MFTITKNKMLFKIILLNILITFNKFLNTYALSDLTPTDLKVEYLKNPLAIESHNPRLSWIFKTNEQKQNLSQNAYQILVASDRNLIDRNEADLWDSNKVLTNKNTQILYNGNRLGSNRRAFWKVRVWDQNDVVSEYSSVSKWETGLLSITDWTAQWISAPNGMQENAKKNVQLIDSQEMKSKPNLMPVVLLRKHFTINNIIKSAKIYATAKGFHRILINGQRVSDSHLDPGWTDYNKTIQYQAYDVTHLVAKNNAIGVTLGTGWFTGYIGYNKGSAFYGKEQSFLLQLHIEYENNEILVIKTDNSWKANTGPIVYSDMLMGELYYANREIHNWLSPDYDDKDWSPVVVKSIDPKIILISDRAEPIRVTQELKPLTKYESSPGVYVFDFEQNMVGWVQLRIRTNHKSVRIQIRHAEALNPNGTIYTTNLRTAKATDIYVFEGNNGTIDTVFEPQFTFHGFRYVEISGYPGEPELTDIVGRVIHSDTKLTATFVTSHPMVNKLAKNIVWGQRGNFISVPTDCPQRDERLGWMGDAQVFAQTAAYNADVAAFYTKWMRDVREAQGASTQGFSDVSPRVVSYGEDVPAWADAGIIVPYTVWRMYGDIKIIEENYQSMTKFIETIISANPDFLWRKRVHYRGDWLNINASTPQDVMSTAYFAYDALLLGRMASAINRTIDAKKYFALHKHICDAFVKTFVNSTNGKINGDTQTAYLLALAFEILPQNLQPIAAKHLAENIKAHNNHLTTGFVGVGYLCSTLTQFGYNEMAYKLLQTDTFPSWGYSIKYNATTIWERWDGWTKEKGFQNPGMNSFNHYSLGSVGRWLYQSVAGIDTDDSEVGFKKIIIKPNPGKGINYVTASYESINGLIKSNWEMSGNVFTLKTTIPVNTKAKIDLTFDKTGKVYEVGSGYYEFKINI